MIFHLLHSNNELPANDSRHLSDCGKFKGRISFITVNRFKDNRVCKDCLEFHYHSKNRKAWKNSGIIIEPTTHEEKMNALMHERMNFSNKGDNPKEVKRGDWTWSKVVLGTLAVSFFLSGGTIGGFIGSIIFIAFILFYLYHKSKG